MEKILNNIKNNKIIFVSLLSNICVLLLIFINFNINIEIKIALLIGSLLLMFTITGLNLFGKLEFRRPSINVNWYNLVLRILMLFFNLFILVFLIYMIINNNMLCNLGLLTVLLFIDDVIENTLLFLNLI